MKKFVNKHWHHLVIAAIPVLFICTYVWFVISGPVPVGKNLEKSDWLTFWGGFLSFAGSVALGVVAVIQNKQANDTNKKAIAENRRQREIEFEHELKKNEYTLIMNGIQEIHHQMLSIVQALNSPLKRGDLNVNESFLCSVIVDIMCLCCSGIDSILPPCYDDKYPILKSGKEQIKQVLEEYEQEIRKSIEEAKAKNTKDYNISLSIPNETLFKLSSFFHNKLNDIQSYRSFVKDDSPEG